MNHERYEETQATINRLYRKGLLTLDEVREYYEKGLK
jgi:hypothetical protein